MPKDVIPPDQTIDKVVAALQNEKNSQFYTPYFDSLKVGAVDELFRIFMNTYLDRHLESFKQQNDPITPVLEELKRELNNTNRNKHFSFSDRKIQLLLKRPTFQDPAIQELITTIAAGRKQYKANDVSGPEFNAMINTVQTGAISVKSSRSMK